MALLKDSLITGDLRVTGTIYGNATSANGVKDYNNGTLTTFGYSTGGMTSTSWVGSWDGYKLRAISPQNLRNTMGLGNTTGALPVANGGTGVTSIANIQAGKDVDGNAIKTTYAKLASPALTGTPTAPTAAVGTNTTQIATTAFVQNALTNGTFSFASASTITGNGSATSFAVAHAFDTRDVIVQVYDLATYDTVQCNVIRTDTTKVTVSFATAPANGKTYRVLISSMTINAVPDVNNTAY